MAGPLPAMAVFAMTKKSGKPVDRGMIMATKKNLPDGVPEENEYHSLHWAVLLTYAVAIAAVYMILFAE